MVVDLIDLGLVTGSLSILVVVPFLAVAFCLYRDDHWPKIILAAIVLGCGLQAVLGVLWSHLIGGKPLLEVSVFAVFCLALNGLIVGRRRIASDKAKTPDGKGHLALTLILGVAFVLRVLHPLQVAYLGQSDAYTHLNYIHNIVDQGFLLNPSYPPGYHWILALPTLVFSVDPYLIARYGGAFFGTVMVLGVYVLLNQFCHFRKTMHRRSSAIISKT